MSQPHQPDITVTAFSQRYLAAFDALIGVEGGFVNDPKDRGGWTMFGVSLRFLKAEGAFDEDGDGLAEFDLDMDGDIDGQDIRKLTLADAKVIYARFFWNEVQAEVLPRPLGEMVFDQAVNGGKLAAKKLLQRALNECLANVTNVASRPALLAIDGTFGSATRQAIDWVLARPGLGMPSLVIAYRHAAEDRYRAIAARKSSQIRFLNGWVRRAQELGKWTD